MLIRRLILPHLQRLIRVAAGAGMITAASGLGLGLGGNPPAAWALNQYCQATQAEAAEKEALRQAAFQGDSTAQQQYQALVQEHTRRLLDCRRQTWPQSQAVWLRLYPCDLQPGILEAVLDRIVNLGYNEVYLEVFYGGQVLLPAANNPTVWPSVVQAAGYERRDLLAETLEKGRARGLKVQAWMFTLNFGYSYSQRVDREQVLALNGRGQTTSTYAKSGSSSNPEEVFVDPYHPQSQADYRRLLQEVLKRRPDGVLFDYVRYPRGVGANSVADSVDDLWIYGDASRNALLQRALNYQGLELMRRYISRGHLLESDIDDVRTLYPDEVEPLWQSRVPSPPLPDGAQIPASTLRPILQEELWRLSVAHAVQGVVDFLTMMAETTRQSGLPAGAVFFPGGNQTVGTGGYDSRLQYWDRFPNWMIWHPMAYAVCGNTGCILDDIRRVLAAASGSSNLNIQPALAGIWGTPTYNRPALEVQMQAIQRSLPEVKSLSHFAYSWQDPEFDRVRKFCRL